MEEIKMNKKCKNCDSKSLEMCLLIRHCANWVEKEENMKKVNENMTKVVTKEQFYQIKYEV